MDASSIDRLEAPSRPVEVAARPPRRRAPAPARNAKGPGGQPAVPPERPAGPGAHPPVDPPATLLPRVVRAGRGGSPEEPGSVLELAALLSREPVTVLVHGEARDLVNMVTYGLVAWVGSEYSWIDVRIGHQPPSGNNPVHLGLVPPDRLVVVNRLDEMAPNHIGREAVRSVIRRDEPRDSLAELSEFVRLPRPIQLALAKTVSGAVPGIIVVSNAHRLIALYDAATVPTLLREVTGLGASVFVSFADEPPTQRAAFDYVLRVVGPSSEEWAGATIEFERAVGRGAPAEGSRTRIYDIAPLQRILSRAVSDRV